MDTSVDSPQHYLLTKFLLTYKNLNQQYRGSHQVKIDLCDVQVDPTGNGNINTSDRR